MSKGLLAILRLESVAVFGVGLYLYAQLDFSWWWFPLFLLVDISMIGYLANKEVGAIAYNIGHSYVGPLLLGVLSLQIENDLLQLLAVMWLVHVGMDRALGYGLKEKSEFRHTHLGVVGSKSS